MSPNPLIIAKGAKAVGAATAGAKAGAAKIAVTEKAAKAFAGATKSIEETTKMGGFQSLENFSENVKQMQPVTEALSVLSAMWTAGTAQASTELMISLINLFQSDGFMSALTMLMQAFSEMMGWASDFLDFITELSNNMEKLGLISETIAENLETARVAALATDWVDPGPQRPGIQEFG